jgi:hypothetical protein
MRRYNVEVVCTTDDPIDSLEYHIKTRESGFEIKMLPTWRPDKAMAVEVPADYRAYVEKLAEVSGVTINNFDDMIAALRKRHDFFAEQGCKLSDHGLEEFCAEDYSDMEIKAIFNKVYGGATLTKEEILKFKSAMLVIFGEMDWEKGWTQQFHYGAIRNNNTKMFKLIGADTGFDSIGEFNTAKAMSKFFDRLNSNGKLTKTILYNLNPCANEMIATAKARGVNLLLPVDNIAADKFDAEANTQVVDADIPAGWMGLDIGPKTIALYSEAIKSAKTVVWNGPMGCFEMAKFADGTFGVCKAVAEVKAAGGISIIGGGDSVAAVNKSGQAAAMSHISTGGGASLEFLEGKELPGVAALNDK